MTTLNVHVGATMAATLAGATAANSLVLTSDEDYKVALFWMGSPVPFEVTAMSRGASVRVKAGGREFWLDPLNFPVIEYDAERLTAFGGPFGGPKTVEYDTRTGKIS